VSRGRVQQSAAGTLANMSPGDSVAGTRDLDPRDCCSPRLQGAAPPGVALLPVITLDSAVATAAIDQACAPAAGAGQPSRS